MLSAPQPLADHHQLADFESGEPSLDDWLKRRAAKNQANGSSRTYVVCEGDTVIGYALDKDSRTHDYVNNLHIFMRNMPNVTIHLDEETHRLAKIHAATTGTSLSQLFRDHVRKLARQSEDEGGAHPALRQYASFNISASDAMDALGLTCLEDLMTQALRAGLHLPHMDARSANAQAQKFLRR